MRPFSGDSAPTSSPFLATPGSDQCSCPDQRLVFGDLSRAYHLPLFLRRGDIACGRRKQNPFALRCVLQSRVSRPSPSRTCLECCGSPATSDAYPNLLFHIFLQTSWCLHLISLRR